MSEDAAALAWRSPSAFLPLLRSNPIIRRFSELAGNAAAFSLSNLGRRQTWNFTGSRLLSKADGDGRLRGTFGPIMGECDVHRDIIRDDEDGGGGRHFTLLHRSSPGPIHYQPRAVGRRSAVNAGLEPGPNAVGKRCRARLSAARLDERLFVGHG